MIHKHIITVVTVVILCTSNAFARVNKANELGAQALSFAGAYRAVSRANDTIYYNPAGLAAVERYEINFDYFYRSPLEHHVGFGLVDSKTSFVGAGIGYNLGIFDEEPLRFSHNVTLALSFNIVPKMLSLGLSGRYVNLRDPGASDSLHKFSGDVGIYLALPFGLSLAAVGHNLVPTYHAALPMSFGFGAAFSIMDLTLACDTVINGLLTEEIRDYEVDAAIEYAIAGFFPLRVGYSWTSQKSNNLVAIGAGVKSPVVNIDFVFQQGITDTSMRVFGGQVGILIG